MTRAWSKVLVALLLLGFVALLWRMIPAGQGPDRFQANIGYADPAGLHPRSIQGQYRLRQPRQESFSLLPAKGGKLQLRYSLSIQQGYADLVIRELGGRRLFNIRATAAVDGRKILPLPNEPCELRLSFSAGRGQYKVWWERK